MTREWREITVWCRVLAEAEFADYHPYPPDSHFLSGGIGEQERGLAAAWSRPSGMWTQKYIFLRPEGKSRCPDSAQNESGRRRKRKTEDLSKWSDAHHSFAPDFRVNISWAVQ